MRRHSHLNKTSVAAVCADCTNPGSYITTGDPMTTPQMKMAIEELQEEPQRNAAEAKTIYGYPGRDQRRKIIDAKDTTCQ
jgi:hypothetical protein